MDSLKYINVIFNSVNLFSVLVLTLFFVCIKYNRKKSKRESCRSLLNGPKTIPFFGNSLHFILRPADIALTLIHYAEKYGSKYRLWIGQKFTIVITNAEDAENAMIGSKFLNKGADFHDIFGRVFKNGTFSAEEAEWKKSRKVLQLPLKTNVMKDYIQIMNEEATTAIRKFRLMANTGEIFDVGEYIASATFNIVCRTLFDLEEPISQADHNIFRDNSGEYLADSFYSMFQPKLIRKLKRIIAGSGKKCQDMFDNMELVYRRTISEQKLKGGQADKTNIEGKNKTFIEYLAEGAFSDEDKKAEIITYSIGGSETLSVTISFVLLMLGMHHDIQDKVYEELQGIFGNSSDRDVTTEDIKQMNYLDQVLKEVLRIFPVVPFMFRTATENTVLGDLKIAAGTELIFNAVGIQKDPKYFPNPESFHPERFSEERSKQLPKGCFIPFAIGPRNCIAKAFAIYEMKILCSRILKKYRFNTTMRREDIKIKYSFVMGNMNGYNVSISERNPV